MIKTIIIEDEIPAALRLQKLISEIAQDIFVEAKLDSIKSSVKWLQQHPYPNLIFLDIQLADGLCFEIFKKIKIDSFIIFTTAFDEYAIKAFELNSIDYLLKPINKSHLVRAINKFKSMRGKLQFNINELLHSIENKKSSYKSRFIINIGNKIKSVESQDIAYFYSLEKSTFLCSNKGKNYPVDFSLDSLEFITNPDVFFRINRQYLVNYNAITNIFILSKSRIKLELSPAPNEEIFVSNLRAREFRKWLDK